MFLPVLNKVILHVFIGALYIRPCFDYTNNLAVDLLSGTTALNRYIQTIFTGEHKLVALQQPPLPITTSCKASVSFFYDLWENLHAPSDVTEVPNYKETESQEAQMDLHGKVKSDDEEKFKRDWRYDMKNNEEYKQYLWSFVKMLKKFQIMR